MTNCLVSITAHSTAVHYWAVKSVAILTWDTTVSEHQKINRYKQYLYGIHIPVK